MPNHVHLVIYPEKELTLGRVIGELKAHSAYHLINQWKLDHEEFLRELEVTRNKKSVYALWQRRCYDHNCQTPEVVREKINYCHMNPVRAGLVSDPGDWLWSSYRWYNGDRSGLVHIDNLEV